MYHVETNPIWTNTPNYTHKLGLTDLNLFCDQFIGSVFWFFFIFIVIFRLFRRYVFDRLIFVLLLDSFTKDLILRRKPNVNAKIFAFSTDILLILKEPTYCFESFFSNMLLRLVSDQLDVKDALVDDVLSVTLSQCTF